MAAALKKERLKTFNKPSEDDRTKNTGHYTTPQTMCRLLLRTHLFNPSGISRHYQLNNIILTPVSLAIKTGWLLSTPYFNWLIVNTMLASGIIQKKSSRLSGTKGGQYETVTNRPVHLQQAKPG
jgi:hypothetical protein